MYAHLLELEVETEDSMKQNAFGRQICGYHTDIHVRFSPMWD